MALAVSLMAVLISRFVPSWNGLTLPVMGKVGCPHALRVEVEISDVFPLSLYLPRLALAAPSPLSRITMLVFWSISRTGTTCAPALSSSGTRNWPTPSALERSSLRLYRLGRWVPHEPEE